MKRKHQVTLLSLITAIGIALMPFAIVKRSFKDWIIVYLASAAGNLLASGKERVYSIQNQAIS